jgi:hypothetical protein
MFPVCCSSAAPCVQVTRFMAAASSSFESLPLSTITQGVMLEVSRGVNQDFDYTNEHRPFEQQARWHFSRPYSISQLCLSQLAGVGLRTRRQPATTLLTLHQTASTSALLRLASASLSTGGLDPRSREPQTAGDGTDSSKPLRIQPPARCLGSKRGNDDFASTQMLQTAAPSVTYKLISQRSSLVQPTRRPCSFPSSLQCVHFLVKYCTVTSISRSANQP